MHRENFHTKPRLTISASGPPKSRNIMRTPSSEDILRRSNGCWRRTLFLTPISSVNNVKPSSMCTPRVHSFPFQLQAGVAEENKTQGLHEGSTTSSCEIVPKCHGRSHIEPRNIGFNL